MDDDIIFDPILGEWRTKDVPDVIDRIVEVRSGGGAGSGGGGGSGSVSVWGDIGGTLANQTDLQTALDAKQPLDTDLTIIAGLTPSNDDILQRKAGAWTNRTVAQYKTDLSLVKADVGLGNVDNTSDANKPVSTAQATADALVASNAASALASHEADTTSVHGISDTASLETTSGAQAKADAKVSDTVYGSGWNGDTTTAPSKNAVYDKIETLGGGGQTVTTWIIAPSGGNYTTLGAALAVAASGDSFLIREGTATESAITTALTDINIIGENRSSSILSIGANTITFSGTNVNFRNLKVTATTGGIAHSGTKGSWQDCNLAISGNGHLLNITGAGTTATNNRIEDTNASTHSTATVTLGGQGGSFINNICSLGIRRGVLTTGAIHISADEVLANMNTIDVVNVAATSCIISTAGNYGTISLNQINAADDNTVGRAIYNNGAKTSIFGNVVEDGIQGIYSIAEATINGNTLRLTGTSALGLYLDGAGTAVSGNMITATGGTGIDVAGANHINVSNNTILTGSVGINIQSGGTWGSVSDNTIASAVTTPIVDASTGFTVARNTGSSVLFDKVIMKMKNTSGGALAAGDVVILKAVAAGDEVTTTTTASDNRVYGMATAAISDNTYGPIQVSGKTAVLKVDGTIDITAGTSFLTTFTTAKIARVATEGTLGTVPGDQAFAIALESYTTNDSAGVIDALLIPPRRL